MMECAQVVVGVRKAKKKQGKHEIDRLKQAEKKKRRLEKALATSAALRSELEKKKQKKKEELDRLDEEGAAIAEAVALHVLLGEESDDSSNVMLKKDAGLNSWDHARNDGKTGRGTRSLAPCLDLSIDYSLGNRGSASDINEYEHMLNELENSNLTVPSGYSDWNFAPKCFEEEQCGSVSLFAGHIAAQAVSSLKIADDSRLDTYVFSRC